jgi:hypothetical protein
MPARLKPRGNERINADYSGRADAPNDQISADSRRTLGRHRAAASAGSAELSRDRPEMLKTGYAPPIKEGETRTLVPTMTRTELVRRLAEHATRPLSEHARRAAAAAAAPSTSADLFVWFEDTSERCRDGRRGVAGLPESLLPYAPGMRVVTRVYAGGHPHLLTAVRIRVPEGIGDRIAALYTAALSVGTIAWIGTGEQYERAWNELYPAGESPALQSADGGGKSLTPGPSA